MIRTLLFRCMPTLALLLSACNGILDNIYDEAPATTTPDFGFQTYDPTTRRGKLYLNVTGYKEWVYIDLHRRLTHTLPIPTHLTGTWDGRSGVSYTQVTWPSTFELRRLVPTDSMPVPEKWDFALHHYDVRTRNATALETSYTSLDELLRHHCNEVLAQPGFTPDEWTSHFAYYDLSGIYNYYIGYHNTAINTVLTRWMDMNVRNIPPTYTLSRRVYLLRMPDSTVAALHFKNYLSPAGAKGYVTIDYVYPY